MAGELEKLVETLPDTITQLDTQIAKIDSTVADITADQTAVGEVMSNMTTASNAWIVDKSNEILALTLVKGVTAQYGGTYGVSDVDDWSILSAGYIPNDDRWPAKLVYDDTFVVSAAPVSGAETRQYNRQVDFPEAYDHLTKAPGTDGTYGVNSRITSLGTAKTLAQANQTAFKTFLKAYRRNSPFPRSD